MVRDGPAGQAHRRCGQERGHRDRDPDAAAELEGADDELDELRDSLYRRLFNGTWEYGAEAAVEAALIGRYFERYADHAVAMARHIAFLAGRIGLDQDTPA